MVEFLQNYGLWIALGGVFVVMHRFGMGCCGGGHGHHAARQIEGVADGETNREKQSEGKPKSNGSCH